MALSKAEISEKVVSIISDQLGRESGTITPQSDIANDLGADSLDLAELMIAFEEEFEIDIDEENVGNITTVGDVIDQIAKQLNSAE